MQHPVDGSDRDSGFFGDVFNSDFFFHNDCLSLQKRKSLNVAKVQVVYIVRLKSEGLSLLIYCARIILLQR